MMEVAASPSHISAISSLTLRTKHFNAFRKMCLSSQKQDG